MALTAKQIELNARTSEIARRIGRIPVTKFPEPLTVLPGIAQAMRANNQLVEMLMEMSNLLSVAIARIEELEDRQP